MFVFHSTQKEMEPASDGGWRDELQKYFRCVKNFTQETLMRIKEDRIRNNLPFGDAFKVSFLNELNSG